MLKIVSFLDTPRHAARFVSLIPTQETNDSALSGYLVFIYSIVIYGQICTHSCL